MTRYQTYELKPGLFGTYDTETEELPTEYISGPYDVTVEEATIIEHGGNIEIVDDSIIVDAVTATVTEEEVI